MTSEKVPFNKKTLESLPLPERGKVDYYFDGKVPGLALAVNPGGARTFYYYRWVHGQPTREKLGRLGSLPIDEARKKATNLNAKYIVENAEPIRKRKGHGTLNVEDAYGEYLDNHVRPHLKPKTLSDYQHLYRRHFPRLKHMKTEGLTRETIRAWHIGIKRTSGPYAANRALALLRAVLNWLDAEGRLMIKNPAQRIKLFKEESRERFLGDEDDTEPGRFIEAVLAEPPLFQDFFFICLFAGVRKTNILTMRWEHVSWTSKMWKITDTKANKGHNVVLIDFLVDRLQARKQEKGYVFPGKLAGAHLTDPRRAWGQILERAEITDLRIHDVRRTLASVLADMDYSDRLIDEVLGHVPPKSTSTRVYTRQKKDRRRVRQALEEAFTALTEGTVLGK